MKKNNVIKVLISSVIILLPIIFGVIVWENLPDTMTTHWGADGNADGFGGKAFAVFGLPLILLALHLICITATLLDKKQKEQNKKALGIVFWIIPFISLFANGIIYGAAFDKTFDLSILMPILLGLMFIFIGNYLPKIKQNKTLGIRVTWTLNDEENWNKTHRFGGKVWVVGGFIMLFSIFLPITVMLPVTFVIIVAISVIPIVYSYVMYRKAQKEGTVQAPISQSKARKIGVGITSVIVAVILVGVAVLMFTGDIKVQYEDTSFIMSATYWSDLEVDYNEIDTVDYRTDLDVGARYAGFGSARLSLGNFRNEEFGSYTLYAYTNAKEYVVLTSNGRTLVIGMSDAGDTQIIYETIKEFVGQ